MRRRQLLRAGAAAGIVGSIGLPSFSVPANAAVQNDPYEPIGRVAVDGAAEAVVGEDGETAYLAAIDGFATVDVSDPTDPTLLADERDVAADADGGPLTEILDVDVSGDRLVVPGPANSSPSTLNGFVLYDVSDPANPVPVTEPYETGFPIHNCFLEGDVLYTVAVANDRNPLVIHDVSGDEVEEVGRWSLAEHDDRWADVYWPVWNLHDVTVRGDVALLAYWDGGTHLLDVSDPAEPTYVGGVGEVEPADVGETPPREAQLSIPGNDHYADIDADGTLLAVGRESWATGGGEPDGPGGIDLYDLEDPAAPERVARIDPPEAADESRQGGLWTTAHNFELRGERLLSSWYRGGVKVHDVADPSNPEELAWWRDPEAAAFWTARSLSDDVFVASSTPILPNSPAEGALYTFPIRAGEQADPPSLTGSAASGETDTDGDPGTGDGNGDDGGNETDDESGAGNGGGAGTDTDDETNDSSGDENGSGDENDSGGASDDGDSDEEPTPGFTLPATIAAGGVALEWARRRSADDER